VRGTNGVDLGGVRLETRWVIHHPSCSGAVVMPALQTAFGPRRRGGTAERVFSVRTAACWTMSRMVMVSCASARGYALGLTSAMASVVTARGSRCVGDEIEADGMVRTRGRLRSIWKVSSRRRFVDPRRKSRAGFFSHDARRARVSRDVR